MPGRERATRLVAAAGAAVACGALGLQLALTLGAAAREGLSTGAGLLLYLSYFTIWTNILVAVALTAAAAAPGSRAGRAASSPSIATAIAAAIAVVAVGYVLLVRDMWSPEGWLILADAGLHYITPALFLAFWWLALAGKEPPSFWVVPIALAYPLAYLAFALARGAATGFFPYPFLDAAELGYASVAQTAAVLGAGYGALTSALVALARARARRRGR